MIHHNENDRPESVPDKPSSQRVAAVSGADTPFLLYTNDSRGRRLALSVNDPRVVLGRCPQADVALTSDPLVSRVHAVIEWAGGHWTIIDGGLSLNGTEVNGRRLVGRRRLRPGDCIRIGASLVTYHATHAIEEVDTGGPADPPLHAVTGAERDILDTLCRPFQHHAPFACPPSNSQIAEELQLSDATVKTHLRALFAKFGVEDLPQNQKRVRLAELVLRSRLVTKRKR
ncbi:FHA domain-containing protein [Rhodococcus koreensis]|uniref:FHA domain-containing protein n=1 Tax=Rhodococcus koreensis TaxID=99653 RepID=UPI00197E1219|nr:FHA domain-containing protein [Rhodococcus koreensis]QSE84967.1 FHA domain-containing protein [Rhodococcus koreensis]